jgi:hypothetical protein
MAGLFVDLAEADFLGIGRGWIQSDRTGNEGNAKVTEWKARKPTRDVNPISGKTPSQDLPVDDPPPMMPES